MSPFSNARSIYFATNSLVALLDVASSRRRQLAVSCVAHVSVITTSRYIGLTFINARVHASVYLPRGSVGCPFTGSLMLRYARSERARKRTCGREDKRRALHVLFYDPSIPRACSLSLAYKLFLLYFGPREFHSRRALSSTLINHRSANAITTKVLGYIAYSPQTNTTIRNSTLESLTTKR